MEKRGELPLTVMIVAGASARRASLGNIASLGGRERIQVVTDSHISVERFAASKSEIILADLDNPASAAAMIHFLHAAPAGTGSIALVDGPEPAWVRSALMASINAILGRDAGPDDLHLALQTAEAGFVLLHPGSVRVLAPGGTRSSAVDGVTEELTVRETEVLRLVSQGLGNREIAERLAISDHTVKFHISSILGKLNTASRTEAVSVGIRRGLIPI